MEKSFGFGLARPLLALLLLLAMPSLCQARRHSHRSAGYADEAGAFDYYLLSLSIAPSFCALSPANQARAECRNLTDAAFRQTPLTVHGLWPNLAFTSVNRQPQHCRGPELESLPADTEAGLRRFMPGGPGLARHEWKRHGSCSGLSPAAYFGDLVRLAQKANDRIGSLLAAGPPEGREVRLADLLQAVAARDPPLARAVVVSCRFARGSKGGGRALIEEIRITLSKDLAPIPSSSVGLRQNSGCPGGVGFLPG